MLSVSLLIPPHLLLCLEAGGGVRRLASSPWALGNLVKALHTVTRQSSQYYVFADNQLAAVMVRASPQQMIAEFYAAFQGKKKGSQA